MPYKQIYINFIAKFVFSLFVLFALFNNNVASANCIPADHIKNTGAESGSLPIVNMIDNLIGLVTDGLFGSRTGVATNFGDAFTQTFSKEHDFVDREWENGLVYKIFTGITSNTNFQVVFYLSVIFLVSYMGVSFAVGLSGISAAELLRQYLKIAIIVFFITPAGWELYLELIFKNVIGAGRYLNRVITATMYNVPVTDIQSPFHPIDMLIKIVFNDKTWAKILALLFANGFLFTIMLLVVMMYVMITVVIVLAKVVVIYATILLMSAVMLSVGPIFIICALFSPTKTYFDSWLRQLIGLFLEQYLLFLSFFLFCLILSIMIKGLFYFPACMNPVLSLDFMVKTPGFIKDIIDFMFGLINKIPFVDIGKPNIGEYIIRESITIIKYYKPTVVGYDLPSNIFSAGGVFIVAMMFGKFTDSVSAFAKKISDASATGGDLAPQSAMKYLNDKHSSLTKSYASGAASAVSGRMLIKATDYADGIKDKVAQREADPTKQTWYHKGITGLMKAQGKGASALAIPSKTINKVIKSDKYKNEVNAIHKMQTDKKKIINEKAQELMQEKGYKNKNEITKDEHEKIVNEVRQAVTMKNGIVDQNLKNLEEKSRTTKISDHSPAARLDYSKTGQFMAQARDNFAKDPIKTTAQVLNPRKYYSAGKSVISDTGSALKSVGNTVKSIGGDLRKRPIGTILKSPYKIIKAPFKKTDITKDEEID